MYIAECYDQLVQFEVQLTVIEYSVTERKSLNVPLHQKTGGGKNRKRLQVAVSKSPSKRGHLSLPSKTTNITIFLQYLPPVWLTFY